MGLLIKHFGQLSTKATSDNIKAFQKYVILNSLYKDLLTTVITFQALELDCLRYMILR